MIERGVLPRQTLSIVRINFLSPQRMKDLQEVPGLSVKQAKDLTDPAIADSNLLKLTSEDQVGVGTLRSFPNLRFILTASVGTDHIDLESCRANGVLVSHIPEYATISVAEHTIGLMLGVSRRIPEADRNMRAGSWEHLEFRGFDLRGKQLGIIGYGRIGRTVAPIAQSFGMKVTQVDVDSTNDEREELLNESDVITLHVPLTESTRHMIGAKQIDMMKRGVVIINTSRGQVIEELALVDGLSSGKVGGVGLDVYEEEPLRPESKLRGFENAVLTPHSASQTHEARVRAAEECYQAIQGFLSGKPVNIANP